MNDLELARLISCEVGENFALAKETAEEYPGYCLVTLRGMCKLICLRVIEARNLAIPKAGDLDTLIREVCVRINSDSQTKDALHKLRSLGNKGAHPEENKLGNAELSDFARSALSYAITALKFAHTQVHPNSPLPAEIVLTAAEFGVKSRCYRATIQEEVEPQYWLGKHFLSKAANLGSGGEDRFISSHKIDEELKKANYWFRLAANQGDAAALYEHGKLLIDRVDGEEYVSMGVKNIFRAANKGNSDANADVGHIYYHGAHDQPQDFVEARKHFEIAAAEDHPSALTMLGVMYQRGEGGPANPKAALEYTKKSAEAGYPTGQLNLFFHYWHGETVERDRAEALSWLQKAADQNHPKALFALAELIQENGVPEKTLADAEELLARCMNSANAEQSLCHKAMFQYARLMALRSDQLQFLNTAALNLQRCYEAESAEGELAQACAQLSKSVIGKIRKLVAKKQGSADEIATAEMIANFYFDNTGQPIPKKSVGLGRLGQTMRELSEAKKSLSPELYERRLLEKITPTLQAQIKRKNAPRGVSTSRSKIGRNDPCPCNSGKKFKHCCVNN